MNATGFFVTIDGPSGIGKSTVTAGLARKLAVQGCSVLETKEPTATPLGSLTRFGTDDYHGLALACLVAADRYQHLEHEIRPALADGTVVVCDRYVASSLVLQRIDGVAPEFLWQLNAQADRPDLMVILLGDPARARKRAERRGLYSRFHRGGSVAGAVETALYRAVAAELQAAGYDVLVEEIEDQAADAVADVLVAAITERLAAQANASAAATRPTASSGPSHGGPQAAALTNERNRSSDQGPQADNLGYRTTARAAIPAEDRLPAVGDGPLTPASPAACTPGRPDTSPPAPAPGSTSPGPTRTASPARPGQPVASPSTRPAGHAPAPPGPASTARCRPARRQPTRSAAPHRRSHDDPPTRDPARLRARVRPMPGAVISAVRLAPARVRHGRPAFLILRTLTALALAQAALHSAAGPAPVAGTLAGSPPGSRSRPR